MGAAVQRTTLSSPFGGTTGTSVGTTPGISVGTSTVRASAAVPPVGTQCHSPANGYVGSATRRGRSSP